MTVGNSSTRVGQKQKIYNPQNYIFGLKYQELKSTMAMTYVVFHLSPKLDSSNHIYFNFDADILVETISHWFHSENLKSGDFDWISDQSVCKIL